MALWYNVFKEGMKMTIKIWRALAAAMVVLMLGASGCILNPEEDTKPPEPADIVWPDLTEKEHCIETILLLYDNHNRLGDVSKAISDHYELILYDDPANLKDYVWNMSIVDVTQGDDPIMTRASDIAGTEGLLKNASLLDFELLGAPVWTAVTDVCDNCWSTTRQYSFTCKITVDGELKSYTSELANVEFVVGPHHNDSNKWAIYQASDLKEQ
jgi:hypothetical protein